MKIKPGKPPKPQKAELSTKAAKCMQSYRQEFKVYQQPMEMNGKKPGKPPNHQNILDLLHPRQLEPPRRHQRSPITYAYKQSMFINRHIHDFLHIYT